MKPKKTIYFDYAAAAPIDPEVRKAMEPFLVDRFHNPSSLYTPARLTRRGVDEARARVAKILGSKPSEIIFTAGGTESINLAIQGVARQFPGSKIVLSAIEHPAALSVAESLKQEGNGVSLVSVDQTGIVNPKQVADLIDDQTVLVSVMYANNEIGTIQPVAELGKLVRQIRLDRSQRGIMLPLYLHTDAAQAAGYLDLSVNRLGVDLMSLNGGKIYGPRQSGCLYIRTGTELKPLIYGGGHERGLRGGTENVPAVIGFATALELAQQNRSTDSRREQKLRDRIIAGLLKIEGVSLTGDRKRRLPNNASFIIEGAEGESLVLHLDREGILASTGSACSTGDIDPSHVLTAIGLSRDQANCSLRLTLGRHTTDREVDTLLVKLPAIIGRLRELNQVK